MRYFFISYELRDKNRGRGFDYSGDYSFENEEFPSRTTIFEDCILAMCEDFEGSSGLLPPNDEFALVVISLFEFKSKDDYDSFQGTNSPELT